MNTHDLDTPCGYCASRGRRDIPGGTWASGPTCAECAGAGYLITSADAERLLAFVQRHIRPLLRQELAALRAEPVLLPTADEEPRPHRSDRAITGCVRTALRRGHPRG